MIQEGSLLWTIKTVLSTGILQILVISLIVIILFITSKYRNKTHFFSKKVSTASIIAAILAPQIIVFLFSILYIAFKLDWQAYPHAFVIIDFFSNNQNFIFLSIGPILAIILTLIFMFVGTEIEYNDIGISKSNLRLTSIIIMVAVGLLFIITTNHITNIYYDSTINNNDIKVIEPNKLEIIYSSTGILFIGYIVWLVFIVPVVEELFYRGLILTSLSELFGVHFAIIFQAVFFAVMHNEWQAFPTLFVSGLIFGLIYIKTRTIFAPIVAHMIVTLLSLIKI